MYKGQETAESDKEQWIVSKLWKILQGMEIPDHLTYLLRNLYAGQEVTELDMEQQIGSKLGKQYIKAVYYILLI